MCSAITACTPSPPRAAIDHFHLSSASPLPSGEVGSPLRSGLRSIDRPEPLTRRYAPTSPDGRRGTISAAAIEPSNGRTNRPTGKSAKTCPAPPTKIFRLTRRANHLYKLASSHPKRGGSRVVTNARWDAMDATASGAQWGRRAGLPVSDRPARGRTTLLTVFARTRRTARGPARPLA